MLAQNRAPRYLAVGSCYIDLLGLDEATGVEMKRRLEFNAQNKPVSCRGGVNFEDRKSVV